MKLAWVVAYPVYGGPHNHVQRMAPHLRSLGVETSVVVPTEPGNAFARLCESPDLEAVAMPMHRLRATRAVGPHVAVARSFASETAGLARLFLERGTDVVVQSTLVPPHAAIAARRADLPLICQIVDTRLPRPAAAVAMEFVRRLADRAMFCGERLAATHIGGRPLRMPSEVFYPPVDTLRFVPSQQRREAARSTWGVPRHAPLVGMIGNLNPQKGWEYFIRAAARVHHEVPDVHFLMVGARSQVHEKYLGVLDREIATSGVPRERFIMTGDSSDIESLLAAMDVKLITSVPRSEGVPTTGLEALSCGVPIVGVDVGAIAEFVIDGDTGFLVAALDVTAIATATVRLLSDPDLRARMGEKGRALATRQFDVRASASQHHAAFEEARAHHAAKATRRRWS